MAEDEIVQVQVLEAASNALFTEEQRALVRFLRYTAPVPCAACGRRSKHHQSVREAPGLIHGEGKHVGS